MDISKNLQNILDEQKQQMDNFQNEIIRLEQMDYVSKNIMLETDLQQTEEELKKLQELTKRQEDEINCLREKLFSVVYSKKMDILFHSQKSLSKKFESFETEHSKNLYVIKNTYERKIFEISNKLKSCQEKEKVILEKKLHALRSELNEFLLNQREQLNNQLNNMTENANADYEGLRQSPLTEKQIENEAFKNNVEMKLGGRIANIAGILLILLGLILGLQYTYVNFLTTDTAKALAAFALGIIFLVAGEFVNQKKPSIFSLGITSGGIAILFASTALSYFQLELLSVEIALLLCIAITVLAFYLSIRYQSQTIANFALIGGYLPVLSLDVDNEFMLYCAMFYFLILSFFALMISLKKDWSSSKYISFILNTLTFFIILPKVLPAIGIVYTMLTFLLYIFIAVIYPIEKKKPISTASIILTVSNILVNWAFMAYQIGKINEEYLGGLALFMFLLYYFLSRYLNRETEDKRISDLILVVSFIFIILAVPLQFDKQWLTFGWLLEATAITLAGIYLGEKWYKRMGIGALGLCVISFFLFDLTGELSPIYLIKTIALALCTMLLLFAGIYKHKDEKFYIQSDRGNCLRYYKYYALISFYFYIYIIANYFVQLISENWEYSYKSIFWNTTVILIIATTLYAYVLNKVKALRSKFVEIFSFILYFIGGILGFILNYFSENNLNTVLPFILLFIVFNISTAYCIWKITEFITKESSRSKDITIFTFAIYMIVVMMQILLCQYYLAMNNMVISIALMVAALLYIIYGFVFKNYYMRRFGLVLAILSVIKFFIIDLYFLALPQKILSYFVLGGVLILISYVYQRFTIKLEEMEDTKNEGK